LLKTLEKPKHPAFLLEGYLKERWEYKILYLPSAHQKTTLLPLGIPIRDPKL
jgi:hypothetical protein